MLKDKVKYSGICGGEGDGSNLKWKLTKSGVLTISGKGIMTGGNLPWNTFFGELHEKIKQVVFEDGITRIGDKAFYFCNKIIGNVVIPDTVKEVGSFAFYECSGIEGIKLSSNLERIGSYAFRGCIGAKGDINLPGTVTFIGEYAFENCENLTGELHFSENLTEIERCAFMHCKGLRGDLILPESLRSLGDYAFSGCEGLNGRLELPGSLKTIEMDTFENAGFTGDLVIPDSITRIAERAFDSCKGLNGTLTIGNGVREIKYDAFYGTNFKEIRFGDSLESIGNDAFSNNPSLTGELNFPATLKYIGLRAFEGCVNVSGISLQDGIEVIADKAFSGIEKAGNRIELPESVWYAGKNEAAFRDSCFANVFYKKEKESDKEYQLKYNGKMNPDVALPGGMGMMGFGGMMPQGFGDVAFVWIPEGVNLTGCGRFADTWLDLKDGNLKVSRIYKGEGITLANIPVKKEKGDAFLYRTEEPFEYKGFRFREFQFVRWNYGCEACIAFAEDEGGREHKLLFGNWAKYADGIWDAYQHFDELVAMCRETS